MPLRFLRYISEFYENLNRGILETDKFPPVLPILLYTGNPRWTAPISFQAMVELKIPDRYIPHFEYYPILVNSIPPETLRNIKNAVSAVFYLENSHAEDIISTIDTLFEIVKNEENEIFMEFRKWLNEVLRSFGDDKVQLKADRVFSQKEVKQMFAATVEKYKSKLFEDGKKVGVKEGRIAGVQEANKKIARGLKQSGVNLEIICRNTGLSIEEIMKL